MTGAEVVVTVGGLALIGLVNWWFFGESRSQEVERSRPRAPSTSRPLDL
jgi:plastocyanin domain-containing protein